MGLAAQTLDVTRYIGAVECRPMSTEKLGQRLIAAVIPAHFKDLTALHHATRIAYSTIHKWKSGASSPRWEQVETVAELVGRNPFQLLQRESSRHRAGDHPEWKAARTRAEERFRNRVPALFYDLAEETMGAALPEHIDDSFVFQLAQFWYQHASDDQLTRADTAAAERELETARASRNLPRP